MQLSLCLLFAAALGLPLQQILLSFSDHRPLSTAELTKAGIKKPKSARSYSQGAAIIPIRIQYRIQKYRTKKQRS